MLATLVDLLAYSGASRSEIASATRQLLGVPKDPRYQLSTLVATSVGMHYGSAACDGSCLDATPEALSSDLWPVGAAYASLRMAVLALEHHRPRARANVIAALHDIAAVDFWNGAKWWIRRIGESAVQLRGVAGFLPLALAASRHDPEFWRTILPKLLVGAEPLARHQILDAITHSADGSTASLLVGIAGADVAETRRRLVRAQAPRLYIRTLGGLAVHKSGWAAGGITVGKRRLRSLLGLLALNIETGVTRDSIMDTLWPDADPNAAVNNLNQTVYKLRRFLDPEFRDGVSPPYLVADADSVRLDADLVRTDLGELRRLRKQLGGDGTVASREIVRSIVSLARGELLPELRYEDWIFPKQLAITEELRSLLLPIAHGRHSSVDPASATHAAAALVALDPLDEAANFALATQLSITGRRAAARAALERYSMLVERELGDGPSDEALAAMRAITGRQ